MSNSTQPTLVALAHFASIGIACRICASRWVGRVFPALKGRTSHRKTLHAFYRTLRKCDYGLYAFPGTSRENLAPALLGALLLAAQDLLLQSRRN